MSALPKHLEPTEPMLLHVVESDDLVLDGDEDVVWFRGVKEILRDWIGYLPGALAYYEALFNFNQEKSAGRQSAAVTPDTAEWFGTMERLVDVEGLVAVPESVESREAARLRLMDLRPTAGNTETPVVRIPGEPDTTPKSFDPAMVRPGQPPRREAGRTPVDFFHLLAAFVGTQLTGRESTPDAVHSSLRDNPSFARACNFVPGGVSNPTPSLRTIQQFDQIMSENDIWSLVNVNMVVDNLNSGLIKPEDNLVHDTSHHIAYSSFETFDREDGSLVLFKEDAGDDDDGKMAADENPSPAPIKTKDSRNSRNINNKGTKRNTGKAKVNKKRRKKSQSKLTKNCRCAEREKCGHKWELADDGAGTVVKHANKVYWAHKCSIIGLPDQGVPLVALAVTDAASHDGQTLIGTLRFTRDKMPMVISAAKRVLDDSAADEHNLKKLVEEEIGLSLNSSVNPKGCKTITGDILPNGMSRLTPAGYLYCQNGYAMNYLGVRKNGGSYLFGPPTDESGESRCGSCPLKATCCNKNNKKGRHVSIPFEMIPRVQPENPPMAKRFKTLMKKRPAVERMIFRLKCQLGERYLHKRGNHNYQTTLDKSMIALHLMLRL